MPSNQHVFCVSALQGKSLGPELSYLSDVPFVCNALKSSQHPTTMNSARQCLRTSIRRISSTKIKTGNPPPPKKPPLQNISRNHHTLLRQPPFHQFLARHPPRRPVAHGRAPESRRHLSDRPHFDPTPHLGSPEPSPSLSQRLRRLTREYGWSAVGVYLALSALDFPFCYLAVRWVGPETVGRWESVILAQLRKGLEVLPFGPAAAAPENPQEAEGGETKTEGSTRVVGSGEDEVEVRARQKGDQASTFFPPPQAAGRKTSKRR